MLRRLRLWCHMLGVLGRLGRGRSNSQRRYGLQWLTGGRSCRNSCGVLQRAAVLLL